MEAAMKNNENIHDMMQNLGKTTREAARELANSSTEAKNNALLKAAELLRANTDKILEANTKDMEYAERKELSGSMRDRLLLSADRVDAIAKGLEAIAELPDPVGKKLSEWDRPNGLHISRVSVPLGVIGIIYESRPNVTADAGALCLKSGNGAILRGGSESFHSSQAIMEALQGGIEHAGLPKNCIQSIPTSDREAVGELLKMDNYVDIIVPRGGRGLIERISEESRIPVIKHLDGICHTYIHKDADKEKAINVAVNAKMRRTGICGATETILIDQDAVSTIAPDLVKALQNENCEIRGDATVAQHAEVKAANDDDWDTEYLDAIVSIKTVSDVEEAINFINNHGSHHTDSIITENQEAAEAFLQKVDSSICMLNASTQFADGGEFGMGAEIGISTGRLHARGPVGLEQLTTYKYVVKGDGQTRPK